MQVNRFTSRRTIPDGLEVIQNGIRPARHLPKKVLGSVAEGMEEEIRDKGYDARHYGS